MAEREFAVEKPERPKNVAKAGKVLYDGEIVVKSEFGDTLKCFPAVERVRLSDAKLRVTIESH